MYAHLHVHTQRACQPIGPYKDSQMSLVSLCVSIRQLVSVKKFASSDSEGFSHQSEFWCREHSCHGTQSDLAQHAARSPLCLHPVPLHSYLLLQGSKRETLQCAHPLSDKTISISF